MEKINNFLVSTLKNIVIPIGAALLIERTWLFLLNKDYNMNMLQNTGVALTVLALIALFRDLIRPPAPRPVTINNYGPHYTGPVTNHTYIGIGPAGMNRNQIENH